MGYPIIYLCVCVCLSVCLPTCLPFRLSLYVCLLARLPVRNVKINRQMGHLIIYLCNCQCLSAVCLSASQAVYPSVCPFVSVCSSICLSFYSSAPLSFCLVACPPACLSVLYPEEGSIAKTSVRWDSPNNSVSITIFNFSCLSACLFLTSIVSYLM